MQLIKHTHQLLTPAKAEELAATLRLDDPEWDYIARHDPKGTGLSFVEAYNEQGVLMGKL